MIETLPLWDDTTPEPDTRADWIPEDHHGKRQGYYRGCRCEPCRAAHSDGMRLYKQGLRRCLHCGTTYPIGAAGGTKFCGDCVKAGVYQRHYPKSRTPERACARCGDTYRSRQQRWTLCPPCAKHPVFVRMAGPLANHHAPIDLVLAIMADPHCANRQCRAYLLEQVPVARKDGGPRLRTNYAIDHDHDCCPGGESCGQCIRGILCRRCNHMAIADADVTRGLADYLTRT